ncbi:MAG: response regulator, partial [Kofleriaceae bacterium]|nr:response regulator [Kofleriaceae bacterium]
MKLLILEESGVARRFIKAELVPAGYEIHEATTPAEAMRILTSVPDIDLITLRVVMAGMDGFEFLAHLHTDEVRQRLSRVGNDRVPAVFVTSSDTDKDRLRGFRVGAADFVQKPWKSGDLLSRVNQVLGRGTEFEGMSVLVVDDSSTARKFIRSSLGRLGIQIHEADDGDSALEFLRDESNSVDLVITDLTMRRMGGDTLILKIRGELGLSELPVIFLSGNPDKARILSLFKMGATDYIEKPFLQEELVSRIRAYLSREKTQKELLASIARLRDMDLVKDQFLAACSHDLRSPLVGILGYAQLLQAEPSLSDKHQEMVGGIEKSGDYLLSLINDLLDIGKMASGRSEIRKDEVQLFDVLTDSVKSLIHTAGPKGVILDISSSVDTSKILGDRSALMRIANNILSNAIKFTPSGGCVKASVEVGRTSEELALVVSDTGIGIKEKDIPELFKRYTSTSKSGTSGEKGTGLGLSIAKELVLAHDGEVVVESVFGQGTSFTVYFPVFV